MITAATKQMLEAHCCCPLRHRGLLIPSWLCWPSFCRLSFSSHGNLHLSRQCSQHLVTKDGPREHRSPLRLLLCCCLKTHLTKTSIAQHTALDDVRVGRKLFYDMNRKLWGSTLCATKMRRCVVKAVLFFFITDCNTHCFRASEVHNALSHINTHTHTS